MSDKRLLTIPKAAKERGLSYGTLLDLVHKGLVRVIRLPGRRSNLLDPADLDAYLESVKVGSVVGSESQIEAPQVAPNKESRKSNRPTQNGAKYEWMERYASKRSSV